MRAADDPIFQKDLLHTRDAEVEGPVPQSLVKALKEVTAADIAAAPTWAFAPIAVLSNLERHRLNDMQLASFAEVHGLPLVSWKLPVATRGVARRSEEVLSELYAHEPSLWGSFVRGVPTKLGQNLQPNK